MKKLLAIADSPKVTTGFSTVAKEFYKVFNEHYNLTVIGALDMDFDYQGELPYRFFPSSPMDALGLSTALDMIPSIKPDIVWIMFDPGNLFRFATELSNLRANLGLNFTIVAYIPIEGFPIPGIHKDCINFLLEHDDKVVFWNESANRVSGMSLPVVNFGIDHAPWTHYSGENKKRLRQLAGLDDFFVVGSVGVNKRTKGYPALIYTAAELKKKGYGEKIKFYCHTEPDNPTMQGYHLRQLAATYRVEEMFLWRPDSNSTRGNVWKGVDRFSNTLEETKGLKIPSTPIDRRDLFAKYDFISRLNCLDLYFDTSQVEGWGLPISEAMACGVPTCFPNDYHVREELFAGGGFMYSPIPVDFWDTWHTGVRLVQVSPSGCSEIIERFYHSPEFCKEYSEKGQEFIKKYSWDKAREEMLKCLE